MQYQIIHLRILPSDWEVPIHNITPPYGNKQGMMEDLSQQFMVFSHAQAEA